MIRGFPFQRDRDPDAPGEEAAKERSATLADDIETLVDRHARRPAFFFRGEYLSYGEFDARANFFARWAQLQGWSAGDRIALFHEPCPDYVALWTGLLKLGICVALIPTYLRGAALSESVGLCRVRALIACPDLAEAWMAAIDPDEEASLPVLAPGEGGVSDTGDAVRPERADRAAIGIDETALIFFTAGTTGPPRAVGLSHARAGAMMRMLVRPCRVQRSERILMPLALYHVMGGLCAIGCAFHAGAMTILEPQAAMASFWTTAKATKASMFFHSGEMCRTLMGVRPYADERSHSVTKGVGAGMSGPLGALVSRRIGVRNLTEFYIATEGLFAMIGEHDRFGSVGMPVTFDGAAGIRVLRHDPASGRLIRDDNGRYGESAPGEDGEVIVGVVGGLGGLGSLGDMSHDEDAVLHGVFDRSDVWYRSGDVMRRNAKEKYFFVDRLCDGFCWKEQNIHAGPICEALTTFAAVAHANVYGVSVPGHRGHAVMAALSFTGTDIDLLAFAGHVASSLPESSRPLFLRLQKEPTLGPTCFYGKKTLREEGFDPSRTDDALYVRHSGLFRSIDHRIYEDICAGRMDV